ncbi:MAG: DUF362 domain-containing protein [Clostridia bacterium]
MSSKVLFAPMAFAKFEKSQTLPAKFERLLDQTGLENIVNGKKTAIKMHLGDGLSYSTIAPVFVRTLVRKLQGWGALCFITDHDVINRKPAERGYTEAILGCSIVDVCGITGNYMYEKKVSYKSFEVMDVAGAIHDADVLIDFSHVKGHGGCGYGGACKNIAMGCVSHGTRRAIHGLEGGLSWDEEKCIHCNQCIESCNHNANEFTDDGKYSVFYHNCTYCRHCVKMCPTGAITMTGPGNQYEAFQEGMALSTKGVIDTFAPGHVYYINVLTQITALCDCWGLTTPSLVPDIGIMASDDMVAVETACLDAIKADDLIPVGLPLGIKLKGEGHLFERIHGKNPFVQLEALERHGLGTRDYELITID